jgi:hypothetical protein
MTMKEYLQAGHSLPSDRVHRAEKKAGGAGARAEEAGNDSERFR